MKKTFVIYFAAIFPIVATLANETDPIADKAESFNWSETTPQIAPYDTKPGFNVIIRYGKEGLFNHEDKYSISMEPKQASAKISTDWGYGRGWRSSSGNSGTGVARITEIDKSGFALKFNLKWNNSKVGSGELITQFPCKWLAHQNFTAQGFDIFVFITENTAEQGAAVNP